MMSENLIVISQGQEVYGYPKASFWYNTKKGIRKTLGLFEGRVCERYIVETDLKKKKKKLYDELLVCQYSEDVRTGMRRTVIIRVRIGKAV